MKKVPKYRVKLSLKNGDSFEKKRAKEDEIAINGNKIQEKENSIGAFQLRMEKSKSLRMLRFKRWKYQ